MPERINFTKTVIDALPPAPAGTRVTYRDTKVQGLTLRVTDRGAKSFAVVRKVNGKMARLTIGPFPTVTPEQARLRAQEWTGQMAAGTDPRVEARKLKAGTTFADLFAWYMEAHAKPHKRTWKEDEANFRRYLTAFGRRQLTAITREDVRALHQQIGKDHGQTAANRTLALIRKVFNEAIDAERFTGVNPAARVKGFKEVSRDRWLYGEDRQRFFDAVAADHDETFQDFAMLATLTGARLSNLLAMSWADIDLHAAVWRIPRTKNGKPQTIALVGPAVAILKRRRRDVTGEWVFPGTGRTGHIVNPRKAWDRVVKRSGLTGLRIHDLRRTLGSTAANLGMVFTDISAMMGHDDPTITAVYARTAPERERQAREEATAPIVEAMRAAGLLGADE